MPKITITPEDILKGELHVPGWYKGEIAWASSKLSSKKDSMNYEYGLSYDTGDKRQGYETREIKSQFNSKAIGFMVSFAAALANMNEKEFHDKILKESQSIDLQWDDSLKGRKIQFEIKNAPREDNGQLSSKVINFAPYDFRLPF